MFEKTLTLLPPLLLLDRSLLSRLRLLLRSLNRFKIVFLEETNQQQYGAQQQRDYHTKTNKCDRNQTFCIVLVLKVQLRAASPFSLSPPIPAAAPAPIPASSTSPAAAAISSTTLIRTIVPEQRLVFSISIEDKYQIVGRIALPGVLNTELPAVVLAPIQTINRVLSIMP